METWKGVYSTKETSLPPYLIEFAECAFSEISQPVDRLVFSDNYKPPEDIDDDQKPEKYRDWTYTQFYKELVTELVNKWYEGVLTDQDGMKWSKVQDQRRDRYKSRKFISSAIDAIHQYDKALAKLQSQGHATDHQFLADNLANWPSHPSPDPTISDIPMPSTDKENPQLVYGLRDTLKKYKLGDEYKVMPFMDNSLGTLGAPEVMWSPELNIAMHSYFLLKSKNKFPLRFILPNDWQKRLVNDNIAEINNSSGESYDEARFIGVLFVKYHNDVKVDSPWKMPPYGYEHGYIPLFIFGPYRTSVVSKYDQPFFSHIKIFNIDGLMVDLGQVFPRKRFTYAEIRDVMYKLNPQRDASEIELERLQNKLLETENTNSKDIYGNVINKSEIQAEYDELLRKTQDGSREMQRLEMWRVNDTESDIHLLVRNRTHDTEIEGLTKSCFDWNGSKTNKRGTFLIRDFDTANACTECKFYGSHNYTGGSKYNKRNVHNIVSMAMLSTVVVVSSFLSQFI